MRGQRTTPLWLPISFSCLANIYREATLCQAPVLSAGDAESTRCGVRPHRCWHLLGACLVTPAGCSSLYPNSRMPHLLSVALLGSTLTESPGPQHLMGMPRGCCLPSTSSLQPSAPRVSVYLSREGLELRIVSPISQMAKPAPRRVKSPARAHSTS